MENVTITFSTLLGAFGFIAAAGAAAGVVAKIFSPFKKLKERVTKIEKYQASDLGRLDELEQGSRAIQRATLALIDHAITGNSVDKLKGAKKELEEYLISK